MAYETLTNCYLFCYLFFSCFFPVTGLPEPRSDHLVIMCQFGAEMIDKMAVVTLQLSTILGPDTSHLTLRIGVRIKLVSCEVSHVFP